MAQQRGPRIFWCSEDSNDLQLSPSKFVEDKSWIMTYDHFSRNFTDLYIKAGSKLMALAGMGDSDSKLRTPESSLVKKYR